MMNANQNGYFFGHGDFRMRDWLLKTDLSQGAKFTYSVLACCSGCKDHAWPTQEYLAEQLSVSVRSIQRYLKELINFGLIKKGRRWVKGKMRCVYNFLRHEVIGTTGTGAQDKATNEPPQGSGKPPVVYGGGHDNLSPGSNDAEKILPADTTICHNSPDNLSPSLNKEESIKEEKYNPPTPQEDISLALTGSDRSGPGKGGDFLSGVKEEDFRWKTVQEFLAADLSEKNLQTWIEPLIFEMEGDAAILRGPNQFFIDWVSKNFKSGLAAAFESAGISNWRLELQTEKQRVAAEALMARWTEQARQAASPTAPLVQAKEDVDSLPLEEQYARLYQNYPRNYECREQGWKIFCRLHRSRHIPRTSELIRAVNRAKNNNPSWQRENGRYAPQIPKWLSERRWLD